MQTKYAHTKKALKITKTPKYAITCSDIIFPSKVIFTNYSFFSLLYKIHIKITIPQIPPATIKDAIALGRSGSQ